MAADAHAPTASEYIVHHLQHLQNIKQKSIIDFFVFLNRLSVGKRLEGDPAVQFVLGYQADTGQWL